MGCHWLDAFQRAGGRGRARARRVQERGCGRGRGVVQGEHWHRPPVAPAPSINASHSHSHVAAPGGARPAAPRQPPPTVATRVATHALVCDAANVLESAHVSPRCATRAVLLICWLVKASRQLPRVSDIRTHARQEAPGAALQVQEVP